MISPQRLEELINIHLIPTDPRKKKAAAAAAAVEPPWVVGISKIDGRGLFATRNIQQGEVIFREEPLLIGPTGRKDSILHACTLCYKELDQKKALCPKGCSLPICEMCSRKKAHQQECELYRKWEPVNPKEIDPVSIRALAIVRGMFANKNQKALIYAMQANTDPTYRNEIRNAAKAFKKFPTDGPTVEYLHRIVAVFNTNAFEAVHKRCGQADMALRALYPLAAVMNHECTPNTSHFYEDNNEMVVKASRFIPKDGEITTTYTKMLWSTKARQLFLRLTKQFSCRCPRCADPKENGTYLGAFYCRQQQCGGYVLPEEPTVLSPVWKCEKCSAQYDAKQMSKVHDFALGTINGKYNNSTLKDMISFINEIIPKICPPTNNLMIEAKLNVIWNMKKSKEDFSFTDYEDKNRYCREILEVLEKLNAGECTLKKLIEQEQD